MTVYVDAAIHPYRGRLYCHLFGEDVVAVHALAAAVGLTRAGFQAPPRARWPHYDLSPRYRTRALAAGAVEADRSTTVRVARILRAACFFGLQPPPPGV